MMPMSARYVVIYYAAHTLTCLGPLDHSILNIMGRLALYSLEPELLSGDITGMTPFSALHSLFHHDSTTGIK